MLMVLSARCTSAAPWYYLDSMRNLVYALTGDPLQVFQAKGTEIPRDLSGWWSKTQQSSQCSALGKQVPLAY